MGKYCQEAVDSITQVDICPTSKEEWKKAANKKNCGVLAEKQNCTNTESFVYHCVIDGFRKGILELCAPKTIIYGYCTEFNVIRGIIRGQTSAKCNRIFPKCDKMYNSSDAYKYSDCYKVVSKSGVPNISSTEIKIDKTTVLIFIFIAFAMGMCSSVFLVVFFYFRMMRKIKKLHVKQLHYSRIKKKAIDTQEPEFKNMEATQTTDNKTVTTTCRRVKGTIEETEKRPLIVRMNKADMASTTDRHAFAMSTTKERFCEENRDGSSRYLKYYEAMDRYFVETNTYKEARKILSENGIIIMTGPPGCGKTCAAVHLIFEHTSSNWTFRKINCWEDLSLVDKDNRTVLLIDNMFSDSSIALHLQNWWEELARIHNHYFASNDTELKAKCIRIIITARTNSIKQACSYMGKVTPILNDLFSIDLSELSEIEKKEILSMQIKFARQEKMIDTKDIEEEITWTIGKSYGPIGFPLCAHLYVCREEYRKSGTNFFSRPIEYLKLQIKDEIERDKSNRRKSLFFVLFFREWQIKSLNVEIFELKNESHCQRFLDRISPDLRQYFGPFDFQDLESEAERLADAFFKPVGEHMYTFFHDSVFEATGAYFCETYVTKTAKYFPLDIIQNQKFDNMTDKQQLTLITRLFYEILDQRLDQVFACKIFQNLNFVECFCAELEKKNPNFVVTFFTVSNKSSPVILPTIFWSSCNNLTYLTEFFYDIVTCQSIEVDYQLYVSLYGLCCARNISELMTINGMLQIDITDLKGRVFKFRDHEGNCILHLIVTSDSSDEFVANAIGKLADDGMLIDSKNSKSVIPLMFAVEQAMPRTKVIETILESSRILRYKDSINYSTVFHYCLRSSNDDEVCANYLNILLREKDATTFLYKDDMDGNTALHIAAKETKRSRIMSILKLLESNVDTVNILNEDGYSPLHLAIRSFKRDNKLYRIECCTKVIILILYSASSNKFLKTSDTAIEECKYDFVKNILRNPEDCENMKKNLDILLEELKWNEDSEILEASYISSREIDFGLQKAINRAVHHLKNVAF